MLCNSKQVGLPPTYLSMWLMEGPVWQGDSILKSCWCHDERATETFKLLFKPCLQGGLSWEIRTHCSQQWRWGHLRNSLERWNLNVKLMVKPYGSHILKKIKIKSKHRPYDLKRPFTAWAVCIRPLLIILY